MSHPNTKQEYSEQELGMLCSDFFETYMQTYEFDSFIDELYWSDTDDIPGAMYQYMLDEADKHNIELIDKDVFDYDTFFYNVYINTEKGLS